MAEDVGVSVSVNDDVESSHCAVGHGTPSSLTPGHHHHQYRLADDCTGCGTDGGTGDGVGDGEACGEWSWELSGPYCLFVCVCLCVSV